MAQAAPVLREVALDDKYALDSGRVYLTGVQALVRLLMLQRQRDSLAGLNTAGFVSGYRGSPLGGLDQAEQGRKQKARGGAERVAKAARRGYAPHVQPLVAGVAAMAEYAVRRRKDCCDLTG